VAHDARAQGIWAHENQAVFGHIYRLLRTWLHLCDAFGLPSTLNGGPASLWADLGVEQIAHPSN
jgi:hypothetical protein